MRKLGLVLMVLLVAGFGFAEGAQETGEDGLKEYDVFLGYPKEDYPDEGTILGDWIEEQTGVRINWEFIVGDLEQRVGIMAASGDYPDAIHPRNEGQILLDAGAYIPLDDLIAEHGENIEEIYGEWFELIRRDDGNIYWLPHVMPRGSEYRTPTVPHALYVQQRVLEANDYEVPGTLEEAVDMLIEFAKDNPETNDYPTKAFTGLFWSWREFPVMNAPSIFSGHPNDALVSVDMVDGKWTAKIYWDKEEAYRTYKLYNDMYLEGLYDEEAFVMDYDQYLAKLSTGSILGFYDQPWQFQQVQNQMLDADNGMWYVPLPVVLEGYEEEYQNPPQPQFSEGIAISVDADDPEGLMQYFNFIADWDTIKRRTWGREGIDYMVDDDGRFYRTEEQVARWRDSDWVNWEYGAAYWGNFLRVDGGSFYPDGINNIAPGNQPSVFQASLRDNEKEALAGLGVQTWAEMFDPPNLERSTYFPAWTITFETGSTAQITNERMLEVRRKYIPLLVMAEEGQYDQVWDEFLREHNNIPEADRQAFLDAAQAAIDRRVEAAGGY